MKVSLILLNYNCSDETIRSYKSLKASFDIIVVDNASDAEDVNCLKAAIPASNLLFNSRNAGYAGGNNLGVIEALKRQVDFIMILNPDISINASVIRHLVELMIDNSDLAAIGPRICFRDQKDIIYSDGGIVDFEDFYRVYHLNNNKSIKELNAGLNHNITYVNGSAILIRNKALLEVGTFIESFFLYFEETEWCLRAVDHNWKIGVDSSVVAYHLSSEKGDTFHYYILRNKLWLAKLRNYRFKELRKHEFKKWWLETKHYLKTLKKPYKPFYRSRTLGLFHGIFRNP